MSRAWRPQSPGGGSCHAGRHGASPIRQRSLDLPPSFPKWPGAGPGSPHRGTQPRIRGEGPFVPNQEHCFLLEKLHPTRRESVCSWLGRGGTRGAGQAAERGSCRGGRALPGDSHPPVPAGWGQREGLGVTGQPCTPVCVWVACPSEAGGKKLPFPCCWTPCCSWGSGGSRQMAPRSRVPCWATQPSLQTMGAGLASLAHGTVPTAGDVRLAAAGVLSPGGDCLPFGWLSRVPPRLSPALQPGQSQLQKLRSPASSAGSHSSAQSGLIQPLLRHLLPVATSLRTHLPCQPGGAGPAGCPGGTAPAWARGA